MSEHESSDPSKRPRRLPRWLAGYQIVVPLVLVLAFLGLLALIYVIAL